LLNFLTFQSFPNTFKAFFHRVIFPYLFDYLPFQSVFVI
jgi:hypothetical protein